LTTLLQPVRVGAQTPVFDTGPKGVSSSGAEVVELVRSTGRDLDIWQRYALKQTLQEREDGKWAALEVATIVARQNGKGDIITARQLGGLFLFGSQLSLYSAHEFKTATEMFIRLRDMIMNTDDLRKRVRKVTEAHGEEGVELLNGNRLRFIARSRGSGRGFSGDDIYLDEAFNLSSKAVGAIMPTMSARPNPQILYYSSAPHLDSEQLRKIQARGRAGTSKRLRYMEWAARNPGVSLDDRDAWYEANPALGIRITEEFVETEREAMDDAEFARERLGIGEDVSGAGVIDMAVWEELEDKASHRDSRIVIAADITPERSYGCISFCGRRADGLYHVELNQHRRGTGWMATELVRLMKRADVAAVVIDDKSQAATLIPEIKELLEEDKELTRDEREALLEKLVITQAQDMATACGFFYDYTLLDGETNPVLRHIGQASLTVAVAGATKRTIGTAGAWAWDRKSPAVDITPLVSVTLALWGMIVHGNKKEIVMDPFVVVL
jgi:hypothetical protein